MKKIAAPLMLIAVLLLTSASFAAPQLSFVRTMQNASLCWRGELIDLRNAADAAAAALKNGGNVYIAGTQRSFQAEGLGRAGGLMLIKALNDKVALTPQDTVLAAADQTTGDEALKVLLERASTSGANVLLFAGPSRGALAAQRGLQIFPRQDFAQLDYAASPGVETVSNVIGMWSWMAELVACSVRRGQLPALFTSNAMPGGKERNAQFRKSGFHSNTDVTFDAVRGLSERYLDALDAALAAMAETQGAAFARGSAMLRTANHVYVAYMGHMFPDELRWPGNLPWEVAAKTQIDNTVPETLRKGDVFFFIGYQFFPWDLTSALQAQGINSVITSSMPPLDHWKTDADIVYINPFWKVQDAAVALPGYDIDILPISGIMQSTIYWQLVDLTR